MLTSKNRFALFVKRLAWKENYIVNKNIFFTMEKAFLSYKQS